MIILCYQILISSVISNSDLILVNLNVTDLSLSPLKFVRLNSINIFIVSGNVYYSYCEDKLAYCKDEHMSKGEAHVRDVCNEWIIWKVCPEMCSTKCLVNLKHIFTTLPPTTTTTPKPRKLNKM